MTSQGPKGAGSGNNVTGIGTHAWTSATSIINDDNSRAAIISLNGDVLLKISNYLIGSNFNFTIPGSATINGISVAMRRCSTRIDSTNFVIDNFVSLVRNGTFLGDNKADIINNWPAASTSMVYYGNNADLWGTTWTPSQINDSTFGFALSCKLQKSIITNIQRAYVDYISITVYYTEGTSEIKSVTGLVKASVKSVNGLEISNIKSINGLI